MQFRFRSLRTRLLFTFLGFSLITVLVILLSIWFYNKSNQLNQLNVDIEQVLVKTLKLTRIEQDFFNYDTYSDKFYKTGQSAHIKEHHQLVEKIRHQLYNLLDREEIRELNIEKDRLTDQFKSITFNLERYEVTFQKVVKLIKKRGFKDEGLIGKMRDQIHHIGHLGYGLKLSEVLLLRRYEKDYLLRKDTLYAHKLTEAVSKYKTDILTSTDLPFWQKQEASLLLDNYIDIFRRIVSIETLMGSNNRGGELKKMHNYANTSIKKIQELLKGINQKVDNVQAEQIHTFLFLSGFAVLLSLVFSYVVSSLITRPITNLSDAIHNTVENDFVDIDLVDNKSKDEVGKLTSDFNLMLQELKIRMREIREKTSELEQQNEELTQINKVISDSEQRLENLNSVKDKFFSIISHDLRSPLNSILGFMNILENHSNAFKPEEMKRFAVNTQEYVNRIIELLENLLQWSLSQTGDVTFNPETLVLKDFVEENVAIYQQTASDKDITFILEVSDTLKVHADTNMLNFILRNIISNAIKFSRVDSEIQIIAKAQDTKVEVSINDQGVGIDEDSLTKIFEPGVKHTTEGTSQEKGTGFGLQVCKKFVEMNHGSLRIESELNKGTRIIFTLPRT